MTPDPEPRQSVADGDDEKRVTPDLVIPSSEVGFDTSVLRREARPGDSTEEPLSPSVADGGGDERVIEDAEFIMSSESIGPDDVIANGRRWRGERDVARSEATTLREDLAAAENTLDGLVHEMLEGGNISDLPEWASTMLEGVQAGRATGYEVRLETALARAAAAEKRADDVEAELARLTPPYDDDLRRLAALVYEARVGGAGPIDAKDYPRMAGLFVSDKEARLTKRAQAAEARLSSAESEVAELRELVQRLAEQRCLIARTPHPCDELPGLNRAQWCWACLARAALGENP